MKYGIGTKFVRTGGKQKLRPVETIVDVYTTTNAAGEVVRAVYVCEHVFAGQVVTDYEVPEATLFRADIGVPVFGGAS